MYRKSWFIPLFFLFACNLFQPKPTDEVVARVGKHLLFKKDLASIAEGLTGEDSIQHVTAYINNWATKMLLLDNSLINLSAEQQQEYDFLVENYKADLYTKAYIDMIAARELNTEIDEMEYENYYLLNRQNFLLKEDLVQLRYVHVDSDYSGIQQIKEALFRFNDNDKKFLEQREIQFKSFSFNDSVWVQVSTVIERVPALDENNYELLLKKNNKIELQDSLGVYLAFVKDVLEKNETAPLSYIKPTISRIILNNRKLDIIKNFEKDIIQDAYKNKTFEIYR